MGGGYEGDPDRDWTPVRAAMLALASRCFKGVRVPKNGKVSLTIYIAPNGGITGVQTAFDGTTPASVAACMEGPAWKLKFAPGQTTSKMEEIYGPILNQ